MILDEEYYRKLWEGFEKTKILNNFNNRASSLSTKFVLKHCQENKPLHINFQNSKETLFETGKYLFVELANDIFLNHYDFPTLAKGNRLRDKRKYKDGRRHDYILKRIANSSYLLENTRNKAQLNMKYDDLVRKFIPIEKGSRQLKGYTKYFSDLNGGIKLDFTPTNFEKKTVFITKKSLWDCLPNRNKIPCAYLPNPREENNTSKTKSIPALHDCLAYFTPKYENCYQKLLLKDIKVKTIIVFDTEADKIEQMLQDKTRFGFNLVVLSNSFSPVKNRGIPCWNWFKEEIEIVDAL